MGFNGIWTTTGRRLTRGFGLLLAGLAAMGSAWAQTNTLTDIDYAALPGNRVQLTFTLEQPPAGEPSMFATENPARIALDFTDVSNGLSERTIGIGVGVVESVATAEAGGRTRAVVKLARMVPFDTRIAGNQVLVTLEPVAQAGSSAAVVAEAQPSGDSTGRAETRAASGQRQVTDLDFRRSPDGAAKIIVTLSDRQTSVDVREEGGRIIADFLETQIPERLRRRLDVTDFATPVQTIDVRQRSGAVRLDIDPEGVYDQIAYQADNVFTIEVKPITEQEQDRRQREEFRYTGERLSLNFQDIEVRSVLQLIADFTGINVVVSDSVSGNITLRLQNVPWDQALDIILRTRGLDKRQNGNVMLIAPAEEIAARERLELQTRQQVQELAPLRTDFVQVNYAKAEDMAALVRGTGGEAGGLLSERGSLSIDQRTNTLIVQDTDINLSEIRRLVTRLDIPVRQVLIESRIVVANDDFTNELGVRFGYSHNGEIGDEGVLVGGTRPGNTDFGGNTGFEVPAGSGNEGLLVDLPAVGAAGSVGLAVGKIGSYLLQLELSAMEQENRGDIISSPRVVTANQKEAFIKQGVEIPFQEASSSGATSISFKEAVLGLTVTPLITPDDRVLLDLEVSQDSRGEDTPSGPAIDTRSVNTQVLVDNGETVVLGGVFERTKRKDVERIPFFGELPLVGWLFRNTVRVDENSELLIFVTPKILDERVSAQ